MVEHTFAAVSVMGYNGRVQNGPASVTSGAVADTDWSWST